MDAMRGANAPVYLVLGVGLVAISWAAVITREADAPALVIATYRLGLAALPVGLLAAGAQVRAPERLSVATNRALVLAGALLATHFVFWTASLQHTSVVTSVVLVAMQPVFVALASPLLLREHISRDLWLALAIAAAGAVTMAIDDIDAGLGTLAGDFYALMGGVFAAGFIIAGRAVRPRVSFLRYVGTTYSVAAVLLLAATLAAAQPLTGYSAKTYLMMGLLALGPQLIGHSSLNWALRYVPAVLVATSILLAEPVGATALAALVLDEWPSPLEYAGGLLVLAGVYLALTRGTGNQQPGTGIAS
jgi:drug/metabolite transporter (DMT)-like permease